MVVQSGQKSDGAAETRGCHLLREWLLGEEDVGQKNLWPMTVPTKCRHRQLQEERTAQNISFSGTTVLAMTQSKETSSLLSSSAQSTLAQALLYKWE